MRVFGRGGMVLACTFFFVSKQWALALIVGYILLVAALSMSSAWMTWRRGDVVGLWVLAAFLPLAAAVSGLAGVEFELRRRGALRGAVHPHGGARRFSQHRNGSPRRDELGFERLPLAGQQLRAFVQSELPKWEKLIEQAGIQRE